MKLPWVAITVVGWAIVAIYSAVPTSHWYELRSVEMTDRFVEPETGPVTGLDRIIEVDRSINAAFQGWYRVEEHLLVNDRWLAVAACENTSAVQYRLDSELPPEITVGWWAWGDCNVLPRVAVRNEAERIYRMCTWVEIEILPFISFFRKSIDPICTEQYRGRNIPRG